jgi:hypothetical protein
MTTPARQVCSAFERNHTSAACAERYRQERGRRPLPRLHPARTTGPTHSSGPKGALQNRPPGPASSIRSKGARCAVEEHAATFTVEWARQRRSYSVTTTSSRRSRAAPRVKTLRVPEGRRRRPIPYFRMRNACFPQVATQIRTPGHSLRSISHQPLKAPAFGFRGNGSSALAPPTAPPAHRGLACRPFPVSKALHSHHGQPRFTYSSICTFIPRSRPRSTPQRVRRGYHGDQRST